MNTSRKFFAPVYANDNDPLVPELWAQESLAILEANTVACNLVHRDFENEIARFGDVVNTRKPSSFVGKRKVDGDNVTVQDATVTNVPVTLNQHMHVSFTIYDGEESKSFKDLVDYYLKPSMIGIANSMDQVVLSQMYRFMTTRAVGNLGTDLTKAVVIDAREALTTAKCPMMGRNLIITPNMEGALLNIQDFVNAEKVGDDGTALREGSLGRKFGFNTFTCQNAPSIATGNTTVTGAVNNVGGYAAGTTAITVDGLSAAITAGSWATIAGDMTPLQITGSTGGATPTAIAIASPGLRNAVANDAVVTIYTPGAINLSAGYAAGWIKPMVIDGFTVAPKSGQLISIGTGTNLYGAINTPTTTELEISHPLVATAANDAALCIGPAGDYGFAFHRNAIALVTRPLAQPRPGAGALSYVANYNGLSCRVTITYNGQSQGHLVTIDFLAGVAVLDTSYGCVVFG